MELPSAVPPVEVGNEQQEGEVTVTLQSDDVKLLLKLLSVANVSGITPEESRRNTDIQRKIQG